MGGGQSKKKEERRRERRRQREENMYQEDAENAPGVEAAMVATQQARFRRSEADPMEENPAEYRTFNVTVIDGKKGFQLNQDTLMITDVSGKEARKELIPPGAIVRQVDGVEVFCMEQFTKHTCDKEKYCIGVYTPEQLGVWKVRTNVPRRSIQVHPETLVTRGNQQGWPNDCAQTLQSVDGHEVKNFGDFQFLTKDKNKFFISIDPFNPCVHSDVAIFQYLTAIHQNPGLVNPDFVTPEEIFNIRNAAEEACQMIGQEIEHRECEHPVNHPDRRPPAGGGYGQPSPAGYENNSYAAPPGPPPPPRQPEAAQPKKKRRRKKRSRSKKKGRR